MLQQLLLGLDDGSAGPVAVSFAAAMARQYSASVHVVHVNLLMVGGRGQTHLTSGQARQLVATAVEELQGNGVEATGDVVGANCFDLALRIVESAEDWSADAILLGSHRHRRLPRLRGNGVRERVIRLSDLPVLTAPAPLKVGALVQPPTLPGPPAQPIWDRT